MSKEPKNLPKEGDECKLKGKPFIGKVTRIIHDYKWVYVDWYAPNKGPYICHLYELEKV